MRLRTIHVIAAAFLALLTPLYAQIPSTPARIGYAPIDGLKMYYEIRGSGDPLVLIHGGVGGIAMFGNLPDTLARHRQVIAVELQGHGRTADIDRPFSYEAMADDIVALLKYLGFPCSDVMGYSLGGEVALQTAIRHPETVRKLILVSTTFSRNGWYPEVLAQFDQMGPSAGEGMKQSPLNQIYPNVNWVALFTKLGDLERKPYDWSASVASLKMSILLIFADADAIRQEHIIEFYGLLGGGKRDAGLDGSRRAAAQLTVLPGATHYNITASPILPDVVTNFLDGPPGAH